MLSHSPDQSSQQIDHYHELKFNLHLVSTSESHLSHETESQQKYPSSQTLLELIDDLEQPHELPTSKKHKPIHKSEITSRKWSKSETGLFYEMLKKYSTDFSIMSSDAVFKNKRSQKELRNKYRKESKLNHEKISKIILDSSEE